MFPYITIIIAGLLGIFGIISKTKKDDKRKLFNELTPFGYLMLGLIAISSVVGFFSQREKDSTTKNEKDRILDKASKDSTAQRSLFILDSTSHLKS